MTTRFRLSITIAAATAAVLAVPGGASAATVARKASHASAKKHVVREPTRHRRRGNLHEARRRYTPPKPKRGKGNYRLAVRQSRPVRLHGARRTYWHHR